MSGLANAGKLRKVILKLNFLYISNALRRESSTYRICSNKKELKIAPTLVSKRYFCAPAKFEDFKATRDGTVEEWWINPCKKAESPAPPHVEPDKLDADQSRHLSELVNGAIIQSEHLDNKYVEDKLVEVSNEERLIDLDKDGWPNHKYDFLPDKAIWFPWPQAQGHPPLEDPENLKGLTLHKFMSEFFAKFQKVAIGLEQLVWDSEDVNDVYTSEFRLAFMMSIWILCSIQRLIELHEVHNEIPSLIMPGITRAIMPDEVRLKKGSAREFRNFMVLRDFHNGLRHLRVVIRKFGSFDDTIWDLPPTRRK